MIRRCEPLFEGDEREVCGARFDDARRMAVCPHVSLDGGDTVGVPPDPEYLVAKGVLTSVDAKAMNERRAFDAATPTRGVTRYALVDVLDLVQLMDYIARGDGRPDVIHVLDRVERAPMATVPCTIKLNEDGGVWVTPDPEPPDPRGGMPRTDVPSNAPEPPLPLLEDFDSDGHHVHYCEARASRYALSPNVAPCRCAANLRRVAVATRLAYERQPARMTFVPAPDNAVRRYEVHRVPGAESMAAWLNVARELQPVTTWTDDRGQLWVLTVQVVPASIGGLPNVPRPATPDQPRSRG